jgi:L-aminopeptidase/D-esterase-like protein
MFDGDTLFVLATGETEADPSVVGLLAARVVERAVLAAVKNARPLCGVKCCADLELKTI